MQDTFPIKKRFKKAFAELSNMNHAALAEGTAVIAELAIEPCDIDTVAITRHSVLFSEEFVDSLDDDSLLYCLAHLALYTSLLKADKTEPGSFNSWLTNLAATIGVTNTLSAIGLISPYQSPGIESTATVAPYIGSKLADITLPDLIEIISKDQAVTDLYPH